MSPYLFVWLQVAAGACAIIALILLVLKIENRLAPPASHRRRPREKPVAQCAPAAPIGELEGYWRRWHDERIGRNKLPAVPWLPVVVRLVEQRGARTVLSLGAGLSIESYLWAECGLEVTAVDISEFVRRERQGMAPSKLEAALNDSWSRPELADLAKARKPGGSVTWSYGDFRDPAVAPGAFDIVEISDTLGAYLRKDGGSATAAECALLAGIVARLTADGALLIGFKSYTRDDRRLIPFLRKSGLTVLHYRGDPKDLAQIPNGRIVIFRDTQD